MGRGGRERGAHAPPALPLSMATAASRERHLPLPPPAPPRMRSLGGGERCEKRLLLIMFCFVLFCFLKLDNRGEIKAAIGTGHTENWLIHSAVE